MGLCSVSGTTFFVNRTCATAVADLVLETARKFGLYHEISPDRAARLLLALLTSRRELHLSTVSALFEVGCGAAA